MADTQLVDFAETKDAVSFKTALHDAIAQKVSSVLDHLRGVVASSLFGESDIGTPGDPSQDGLGGAQASASYMPSPKGSVKFPGNTGGSKPQGAGPDLNTGAVDPNSPEFNLKGSTDTPSPLPANEEKWLQGAVNPAKKGMFAGRSLASLKKQAASLKKSGPHAKGSSEFTKEKEVNFAISRKERHGA